MVLRGSKPRAKARGYKEKQGKCQDLPPIYHLAYSTASCFTLFPFAPNHWQFRQRYNRCPERIDEQTGSDCGPEVLVLYLKRPRAKSWELRRCGGRFRYSDLKEAAPGDYGTCIWMSRC